MITVVFSPGLVFAIKERRLEPFAFQVVQPDFPGALAKNSAVFRDAAGFADHPANDDRHVSDVGATSDVIADAAPNAVVKHFQTTARQTLLARFGN